MRKFKRWTQEEDQVLVHFIKEEPLNKKAAFKKAAELLNRDVYSCKNRWYTALSNPESKYYVGACFTMLGIAAATVNRTRYSKKIQPIKIKESIWTRILKLLRIK